MYIDSQCWSHRNRHKLPCWPLFFFCVVPCYEPSVPHCRPIIFCPLSCATVILEMCPHKEKEKNWLSIQSSYLSFFFPSSILLTHVLPYPTHLHRQPITFALLTPLCTCVFAQYDAPIWVLCISKYFWRTENIFADEPFRNSMSCNNAGETKQKKRVKMIFFLILRCVRLYGTKGIVPDCIMWSVLVVWGILFRWK